MRPTEHTSEGGFSLVEVLISALVLSIGLLGLAGLHVAGMRSNHSAFYRSQATNLGYEIIDRMRLNARQARAGKYNVDLEGTFSSDDAVATSDMAAWEGYLAALPSPDRSIGCEDDGDCVVVVQWDDSRPEREVAAGEEEATRKGASSARRFTVRTRI